MNLGRVAPFLAMLLLIGCGKSGGTASDPPKGTYIADANSVGFDISPVPGSNSSVWIGTYSSQGKTARFQFEFGPGKEMDSGLKGSPATFGQGRFVALPDSDASALLLDLKKALEAKKLPGKSVRLAQLPFEYVRLGENQSQAPSPKRRRI